jgi:hypothetical protein
MKKGFAKGILGIGVLSTFLAACSTEKLSPIPQISNPRITDSQIHVGERLQDTLLLSFEFQDGDGDISGSLASLFFKNELDSGAQVIPYPFPEIQDGTIDPDKGAKGTAVIILASTAPIFPVLDSLTLRDTVRFSYYMKDEKGNQSNTLTTPNIILLNP